MENKKKKYTTETFFDTIVSILQDKEMYPDILDYNLANTIEPKLLETTDWDVHGDLEIGKSEGIYLTINAQGDFGRGHEAVRAGTFKTLSQDRESFHIMAKLMADFLWEAYDFVNKNSEDFNWTGYDVKLFREGKRIQWKWVANSKAVIQILLRKDFVPYDHAEVINNKTCRVSTIRSNEVDITDKNIHLECFEQNAERQQKVSK